MVFADPAEYPVRVQSLDMVRMVQQFSNAQRLLGGGLLLVGALALAFPELLAARIGHFSDNPSAGIWLVYGFAMALLGLGGAVLTDSRGGSKVAGPFFCLLTALCMLLSFLALTMQLQDWWIDDAGITFAYSRSLAEGLGLVAQPWMAPEEGYSSTTWMLLLSVMHRLGVDIPIAAKIIGVLCSALAMMICIWIVARETRSPLALTICGAGIACAPTVVWAASGQEHALQSLILVLIVLCVYTLQDWRWPVAGILAVFVLTRPEAPIIVIAVFCAGVYLTRRAGGRLFNAADAAVALMPFAVFCALITFRMIYFDDPMPNPYYAKSSGTGFAGLFNPLGAGWHYVLWGLRSTALLLVLLLVFQIRLTPFPDWLVIAVAVLIGHMIFVVWAKGDWMSQHRFLMPVVPLLLLVASLGLAGFGGFWRRAAASIVAVMILLHTSILQTATFWGWPTTPLAAVSDVGNTFRALASKLDMEDPLLAHHDAGGIAYHRIIHLLDLGGLVNRDIAKNMDNKEFLTGYVVEEMRPDFVFGARRFAAASGFAETASFEKAYVRLAFADLPFMATDLSYIRRDRVVPAPGIDLEYDEAGTLSLVTVHGRLGS